MGSSFSIAVREATPLGIESEDVERCDRFIKLWPTKIMIAGGLWDFEHQLDARR